MDYERLIKTFVRIDNTILDVIRSINESGAGMALIVDDKHRLLGVVADGDIRRGILNGIELNDTIDKIMVKNFKYALNTWTKKEIEVFMIEHSLKQLPVLDEEGTVIDLLLWNEIFGKITYSHKDIPVFIMAGGKGTRLNPVTRIIPKPMIPIDNKPMLEVIIEKFKHFGFDNFIISVGYKAEVIESYFNSGGHLNIKIEYVKEEKPLGTAGSLRFVKDKVNTTLIVTNSDIIVDDDIDKIYKYHRKNDNQLTVVSGLRTFRVPYGVCITENGGTLKAIDEKPEYNFMVNVGLYLMEPEVLDLIPEGKYDMDELIKDAIKSGMKVKIYPTHKSWFDIGQWEEYKNTISYLRNIIESPALVTSS